MEIAEAVPYTIEGGKDIPYKIDEGVQPINELFDLSYTDYHFYKEHFLENGLIHVLEWFSTYKCANLLLYYSRTP